MSTALTIKENEPLSKHTNFRIGGPARWFVEAKTEDELLDAIGFAHEKSAPFQVIGGGSNTLASDEGFSGVVIQMAMRKVTIPEPWGPVLRATPSSSLPLRAMGTSVLRPHGSETVLVVAEAGAMSAAVARQTAEAGLQGMEWAISLPGTIGGAVRGNAGCFGGEMRDTVTSVRLLRDGKAFDVGAEELHFGYRESAIKHSKDVVLSVTMELKPGDAEALKAKLAATLEKRKASQPLYAGSAGCIFKNYEIETDEDLQRLESVVDILTPEMKTSRRVSAGWLIDKLGLKGTQIGQAKISEEHGNFIVNLGGATASDVVQIIALVKTRARNEFGIQMQEEVHYLGF